MMNYVNIRSPLFTKCLCSCYVFVYSNDTQIAANMFLYFCQPNSFRRRLNNEILHRSNCDALELFLIFLFDQIRLPSEKRSKKYRWRTRSEKLENFFKKKKVFSKNGNLYEIERSRTHSVTFGTRSWSFRNETIKNIFCWFWNAFPLFWKVFSSFK